MESLAGPHLDSCNFEACLSRSKLADSKNSRHAGSRGMLPRVRNSSATCRRSGSSALFRPICRYRWPGRAGQAYLW